MKMKIDILTLFPEMFAPLRQSIIGRAEEKGIIEINLTIYVITARTSPKRRTIIRSEAARAW